MVKQPKLAFWIICAIVVGTFAAALAAPPIIPVTERKFDHARHEKAAANAKEQKRQAAACKDCHQMDDKGIQKKVKEHSIRCVKCHDDPKTCALVKKPGPKSPARRCDICHLPTGNCDLPKDIPPKPAQDSFEGHFTHGKHIQFGASIERECATCHKEQAPVGGTGIATAHSLCSTCHDGQRSKLGMTNCAGCHLAPQGKAAPSSDPFRLTQFDHKKHHRDSQQSSCTTCHTKMTGTTDDAVPRPAMLSCQTACHNGQKAFSAVGTKCTSCHKSAGGQVTPNRTDMTFSHQAHIARNVQITDCNQCHQLKPDGNLEPTGTNKNHMPCSNSGCHQTEFASRTNKICGICHDISVPWQKTVARPNPTEPIKPDWHEDMNHFSHLKNLGANNNAACGTCHGDKLGGAKRPGGHEGCANCHGKGQGFPMTSCQSCHRNTDVQHAPVSQWSVRALFDHQKHANDPRKSGKSTQCVECHKGVKEARDLATIKKPTMLGCGDSCHNGKLSFKVTGFDCAKCHSAPKTATPPPPASPASPSAMLVPEPALRRFVDAS